MPKKQSKNNEELEKISQERDANLAGWKRSLADFENYKKQFEKEKEAIVQYLKADAVMKLLPIMANWEVAVKNVPQDQKDSEWIKGIIAIKSQLDDFFKKEGLEKVITVGEKFDPNLHEAMLEEESDQPEGIILEEFEPGYRIGERVIKYPKVKVSKKK
ncbi:MAG TPA: nucleotide exchange factor GrpE [Patescibacteria group bacterium]|nr:nucleotide exchange factor GrpE [Patescibacteria group bacterium]